MNYRSITNCAVMAIAILISSEPGLECQGSQAAKQKVPPAQNKSTMTKQAKVPAASDGATREIAENIPKLFLVGKAPYVRVLFDGPPEQSFRFVLKNDKWVIDPQSAQPKSVPKKYMVVGAVQEGTRIESPGELHIGSCQVIWQTELVSAPPAAGALGAVSPSGGESKRLVNTPIAGASNCSVAVEVERGGAANR